MIELLSARFSKSKISIYKNYKKSLHWCEKSLWQSLKSCQYHDLKKFRRFSWCWMTEEWKIPVLYLFLKISFPSPVLPNVKEDQDWLTWFQIQGTFQCKSGPKWPTNPDQYNKIWLIPDFYENSQLFKHWIAPIALLFYAHNY